MHSLKKFIDCSGKFVKLEDTIKGFKSIVDGEHDNIPESAFYMVGTIEEALEKSKKISKEE